MLSRLNITSGFQGKGPTRSKNAGLTCVQMVLKTMKLDEINMEVSVDSGHSNINIKVREEGANE